MKTYYLAKILHKLRLSSFKECNIHSTARVDAECCLSKVSLGRYSYVGSGTSITDTSIGSFCSIGSRCGIGGGIHPIEYVSTSPIFLKGRNILGKNFARINYEPSKRVVIGNDVWIGDGVCILSGVKIGTGSIIGAHSVVTHDVKPYSVIVGVPGKAIRKRFNDEIITQLLELAWWDWPDEKLKIYGQYFSSYQELLRVVR